MVDSKAVMLDYRKASERLSGVKSGGSSAASSSSGGSHAGPNQSGNNSHSSSRRMDKRAPAQQTMRSADYERTHSEPVLDVFVNSDAVMIDPAQKQMAPRQSRRNSQQNRQLLRGSNQSERFHRHRPHRDSAGHHRSRNNPDKITSSSSSASASTSSYSMEEPKSNSRSPPSRSARRESGIARTSAAAAPQRHNRTLPSGEASVKNDHRRLPNMPASASFASTALAVSVPSIPSSGRRPHRSSMQRLDAPKRPVTASTKAPAMKRGNSFTTPRFAHGLVDQSNIAKNARVIHQLKESVSTSTFTATRNAQEPHHRTNPKNIRPNTSRGAGAGVPHPNYSENAPPSSKSSYNSETQRQRINTAGLDQPPSLLQANGTANATALRRSTSTQSIMLRPPPSSNKASHPLRPGNRGRSCSNLTKAISAAAVSDGADKNDTFNHTSRPRPNSNMDMLGPPPATKGATPAQKSSLTQEFRVVHANNRIPPATSRKEVASAAAAAAMKKRNPTGRVSTNLPLPHRPPRDVLPPQGPMGKRNLAVPPNFNPAAKKMLQRHAVSPPPPPSSNAAPQHPSNATAPSPLSIYASQSTDTTDTAATQTVSNRSAMKPTSAPEKNGPIHDSNNASHKVYLPPPQQQSMEDPKLYAALNDTPNTTPVMGEEYNRGDGEFVESDPHLDGKEKKKSMSPNETTRRRKSTYYAVLSDDENDDTNVPPAATSRDPRNQYESISDGLDNQEDEEERFRDTRANLDRHGGVVVSAVSTDVSEDTNDHPWTESQDADDEGTDSELVEVFRNHPPKPPGSTSNMEHVSIESTRRPPMRRVGGSLRKIKRSPSPVVGGARRRMSGVRNRERSASPSLRRQLSSSSLRLMSRARSPSPAALKRERTKEILQHRRKRSQSPDVRLDRSASPATASVDQSSVTSVTRTEEGSTSILSNTSSASLAPQRQRSPSPAAIRRERTKELLKARRQRSQSPVIPRSFESGQQQQQQSQNSNSSTGGSGRSASPMRLLPPRNDTPSRATQSPSRADGGSALSRHRASSPSSENSELGCSSRASTPTLGNRSNRAQAPEPKRRAGPRLPPSANVASSVRYPSPKPPGRLPDEPAMPVPSSPAPPSNLRKPETDEDSAPARPNMERRNSMEYLESLEAWEVPNLSHAKMQETKSTVDVKLQSIMNNLDEKRRFLQKSRSWSSVTAEETQKAEDGAPSSVASQTQAKATGMVRSQSFVLPTENSGSGGGSISGVRGHDSLSDFLSRGGDKLGGNALDNKGAVNDNSTYATASNYSESETSTVYTAAESQMNTSVTPGEIENTIGRNRTGAYESAGQDDANSSTENSGDKQHGHNQQDKSAFLTVCDHDDDDNNDDNDSATAHDGLLEPFRSRSQEEEELDELSVASPPDQSCVEEPPSTFSSPVQGWRAKIMAFSAFRSPIIQNRRSDNFMQSWYKRDPTAPLTPTPRRRSMEIVLAGESMSAKTNMRGASRWRAVAAAAAASGSENTQHYRQAGSAPRHSLAETILGDENQTPRTNNTNNHDGAATHVLEEMVATPNQFPNRRGSLDSAILRRGLDQSKKQPKERRRSMEETRVGNETPRRGSLIATSEMLLRRMKTEHLDKLKEETIMHASAPVLRSPGMDNQHEAKPQDERLFSSASFSSLFWTK